MADDAGIPEGRLRIINDVINREVGNAAEVLNARIDGVERGISSFQADLVRVPTSMDRAITGLRELMEARLDNIEAILAERTALLEIQFGERDKRLDQQTALVRESVVTALQSAKELVTVQNAANNAAIAKSEVSTGESIKQLQQLFNSGISVVNEKLNDTRSRLDRGDGTVAGAGKAHGEQKDVQALVFSIVSIGIGVAALLVAIFITHR